MPATPASAPPTPSPAARQPGADRPAVEMVDATLVFTANAGVHDISLSLPPGTILGLIGPSGCGKTTTVRLMLGLYRPQQGQIRVLGENPAAFHRRTREKIGYMPQHFVLYPNLTVDENLRFVASLYGMGYRSRRKRLRELLEFVELSDARDRLGSQLSGGMQRRLGLACALVHNPRVIFADEPTAGIDPVLRAKFWEHFRALRDAGHTLVITTQYVGEATYCDYVGVMREGRMLSVASPEDLRHTVMGGEVIRIKVDPNVVHQAAHLLVRHELVRHGAGRPGVQVISTDTIDVHVEEASDALPVLVRIFDNTPGIEVRQIEEHQPPFDDIFVAMMRSDEQAAQHASASAAEVSRA